jgi:NAD-dependent dihydropyrimidine dehydrogenase PreA subunit
VPCRIGVDRLLEIVTAITEGRGRPEQLDLLADLSETIAETSLCGLGKTAPNPVLSTLRYFREEYLAHILEKRCPAGVCKALIAYTVQPETCTGCGECQRACPHGAVKGRKEEIRHMDPAKCQKCGICFSECPSNAIAVI